MQTDVAGRVQLLIEVTAANLKRRLTTLPFDRERANDTVTMAQAFDDLAEEYANDANLSPDGRHSYTLKAAREIYASATTWEERVVGAYTTRIAIETAALQPTTAR